MRLEDLDRGLKLLLLLTDDADYTALDMCEKLSTTRRNLYYYFDFLRKAGFNLVKTKYHYHLDRNSPFFMRLHDSIEFTEDEAVFMRHLLENSGTSNPLVGILKRKLDRFYDFNIMNDANCNRQLAHNVEIICEAIKTKHIVVLKDYSSPHGGTVADRYVEPFMMMGGNNDVRCYEVVTNTNKTFKISRVREVQMVDAVWGNEDRHKQVFTDIFMFSGEERHSVGVILGQLSCNLLREEYPHATKYLTQRDDGRWLFKLDVCSFLGIGRFVTGLFDDIEILGDDDFKAYMKTKISAIYIASRRI